MKFWKDRLAGAVLLMLCGSNIYAQESVNAELDSCINNEKISTTAKGALAGAMTGALSMFMGGKKEHVGKAAAVGAVAGGALGYATAYYKAAGICIERNPAWVPESRLQRKENYQAVVKEFKYSPAKGDFLFLRPMQAQKAIAQGGTLPVKVSMVVLTPDGGEAKVHITRKLFAIAESKEEEVPFFGRGQEERVVENGEHVDEFNLPVGKEIPVGTRIRIEYQVALKESNPVVQTTTVEVKP